MEPLNLSERRKKLVTLGILLAVTAVLLFILVSSVGQFGSKDETVAGNAALPSQNNNDLLQLDESLHNRLGKLQQYDESYANMLSDSTNGKNFDSLNLVIAKQEEVFRIAVDSFERVSDKIPDQTTHDQAMRLVNSFKSILQYRKSLSTLRTAVAISNPGFSPDDKQVMQLQADLMDKDDRINELETSLAILNAKKRFSNAGNISSISTSPSINNVNQSKLNESIVLLESKVSTLTDANNDLKQQNDLLKQKAEANKTTTSEDADFKNKTLSLQQKVDDLNAELRLAQVDCNLSRVDATQIISNARQRKQLLSEASSILTDLSTANNAEVRKKVKDKIARLNQVAANSRE